MSVSQRPPIPSLIPESAPFTVEQRTWLNGLFAGLFGLPENVTPVSTADATKLLAGLLDGAAGARSRKTTPPKLTTAPLGTTRRCRCPTA